MTYLDIYVHFTKSPIGFFFLFEKEEKSLKSNEIQPVLLNNLIKHSKLLFKLVSLNMNKK